MLAKYILVLLFCCVYGVVSISSFFEKGQRPELYELMDDEMPTLRINIPNNEYEELKEGMKITVNNLTDSTLNNKKNLNTQLVEAISQVKFYLKFYKQLNFKEIYSGYDFDEILPQLQIGEDGYPQYDVEEVFAGFDYDPEHYEEYSNEDLDNLNDIVFRSNKDFDLYEILTQLQNMERSISDPEFFQLYLTLNISFETWEVEQFNKYVKISEDNTIEEPTENIDIDNYAGEIESGFKTKNATMTFEINGNISSFKKVTFKEAGAISRGFPKPMFNIKIKNGEDLYGRSHFKLRSDMLDPTYIRSKLVSDIRNRLGIESISTNYVQFYLNDEFMGLYIMTDVINLPWIEDVYGDKKSTTLYKCNYLLDFTTDNSNGCVNKNEDVTDDSEWINFLTAVENAKSASDLEDILDIDHVLYEMAIDYLTNAFDHYVHNFYMYKQPNGKWTYLSFDFDQDFSSLVGTMTEEEYFKSFMFGNRSRFYDLFISQDPERFNNILKDIVNKVINPATLYSHIDEIKQFLKPYVILDRTPDANGKYPGAINEKSAMKIGTYEEWDKCTEFDKVDNEYILLNNGLKIYILNKYRFVCNHLNMECDPIYMDKNYLDNDIDYYNIDDENKLYITTYDITTEIQTEIPSEIQTEIQTEPLIEKETVYDVDEPTFSTDEESSFDEEDNNEYDSSYTTSETIKTITKTQTIIYTTISN